MTALSLWHLLALLTGLAEPARSVEKIQAPTPELVLPITAAQVRTAVVRSLPFLEKEGVAWMDNRKCIACHHAPFLLWSHNEARRRGFAVDAQKLDAWTARALDFYLAGSKNAEKKKNGCVEATNLLLGRGDAPASSKTAAAWKTVAFLLVNGQRADGTWKYEGQEQKRSKAAADEATTLWAMLALTPAEKVGPSYAKQRERILAWLKKTPIGEGNEPVALRLVIAAQQGDAARTVETAKLLLARQNADGGWSWGQVFPSDSYATGQSLYALIQAGFKIDHPAVQRALRFLLERQRPDGSWYAPTKKPTNRDNPIASYWGSAWATIGLLGTLPRTETALR